MCELLGMSFNLPVNPSISFRGFRFRGEENPDGWGMAFYPDEAAQIIKEPISAKRSELSEFLQNYKGVKSKIFIGHVRYASRGAILMVVSSSFKVSFRLIRRRKKQEKSNYLFPLFWIDNEATCIRFEKEKYFLKWT